jgi:hypothetical protein
MPFSSLSIVAAASPAARRALAGSCQRARHLLVGAHL